MDCCTFKLIAYRSNDGMAMTHRYGLKAQQQQRCERIWQNLKFQNRRRTDCYIVLAPTPVLRIYKDFYFREYGVLPFNHFPILRGQKEVHLFSKRAVKFQFWMTKRPLNRGGPGVIHECWCHQKWPHQ